MLTGKYYHPFLSSKSCHLFAVTRRQNEFNLKNYRSTLVSENRFFSKNSAKNDHLPLPVWLNPKKWINFELKSPNSNLKSLKLRPLMFTSRISKIDLYCINYTVMTQWGMIHFNDS